MDNDTKSSRFKQHLQILGIEDQGLADSQTKLEKQAIDDQEIPDLVLPGVEVPQGVISPTPARSQGILQFFNPYWSMGVLAAALAAIIFFPDQRDSGYRFKGDAAVKVYRQTGTTVAEYIQDESKPLESGDTVKVEILASQPLIGFLFIRDRDGKQLLDFETVWSLRSQLAKGESRTIGSAFALTDPNQGEAINVLCCKAAELSTLRSELQTWFQSSDANQIPSDCSLRAITLRK